MMCGERDTVLYFYFGNGTMVSSIHFNTGKSGFYVMSFYMAAFNQLFINI